MMPIVSVIIPVHNAERYVRVALRSVLAQTYTALEIIVVDDGSTDRSAEIVEDVAAKDSRVKLYRQAKRGASSARNRAIEMSHGEFIAPLDADDVWHPQKIEKQVALMQRSPAHVGLVYCWTQRIDEDGRILKGKTIKNGAEGSCLRAVVLSNPVGHASGALIRREAVIAVGGFCEVILSSGSGACEDHKLYLQLAERYEFALIREILVGYRRNGAGVSRDAGRMITAFDKLMDWVRDRHPELPARLLRRSRTMLIFWLVSDTDDDRAVYELWPVFGAALRADPLFLVDRWFSRWFVKRLLRHIGRRFAKINISLPAPGERALYMPSLYTE